MANFFDQFDQAQYKSSNFFDQFDAPAHPSVAGDIADAIPAGLAKGAIGIASLPGELGGYLNKGIDKIAGALGLPVAPTRPIGTNEQITKAVEKAIGHPLYEAQTVPGQYVQTAAEFLPAAIGGPETIGARLLRALGPAVTSETAGQLTKGTAAEPYARLAGAVAAPTVAAAGRRIVTPLPAAPERQALVNTLRNEGVDLTAGQATGSRPLQWAESTFGDMPGSGGRPATTQARQAEQFTGAALRRAGEVADRATPPVIDNAFTRIGNQFETVGRRNNVRADMQFANELAQVENEYNSLVGPNMRAPVIENSLNDIWHNIAQNGGHLTGQQYNAMTSRLARQARSTNDPQLREALYGVRHAIDDAFERTLTASGNLTDLAALRQARREYRNLLVLEKAATGPGSATAEGLISPSQLRGATVGQNRRAYARGHGDFADLARAGEGIMRPLPNSGTAPRQWMQHALSVLGGVLGGTTAGLPGAVAGLAAPGVAGRVLMSRPVQGYLGNQLLARPATPRLSPNRQRLMAAAVGLPSATRQRLHVDVYPDR